MSPEEKEMLKRSVALAEENNNILRSMRRSMRLARAMSVLYWVFIIGSAVGAYYLIQPYIQAINEKYDVTKTSMTNGFSGLLDNFKSLTQ